MGIVLHKILDQYVSSYQSWIKSVIRLGNNEVLKTLMKTLTFVDANTKANANANSTIAVRKHCSGKLKMKESEETEEIKTFPLLPYLLQGQQPCLTVANISWTPRWRKIHDVIASHNHPRWSTSEVLLMSTHKVFFMEKWENKTVQFHYYDHLLASSGLIIEVVLIMIME